MDKATAKKKKREKVKTEAMTVRGKTLPAKQTINTVDDLIVLALKEKSGIEQIDKLMQMKYRHEEREARKEYFLAMSRFQAEVPTIRKKGNVNFTNKVGTITDYDYAPLGEIVKQIKEPLANNLLSYSYEIDDATKIKVKCIVTHAHGHSESTSMTADPDATGGKNTIQSRGSTITYLSRYTLLAKLGLVTADKDNDGQTADDKEPAKKPKTHNTKPGDVLPPEPPKEAPARQSQELIIKVKWADLRKADPIKYTIRFFNDTVQFLGSETVKRMTDKQLVSLIKELECHVKHEKEKADADKTNRT